MIHDSLFGRLVLAAASLLTLADQAPAQWASTPHVPANPVTVRGFLAVHENALGLNFFSASSRKWTPISPPGSTLVGAGDWAALVQEPAGVRGYSARRNDSALLPVGGGLVYTLVDDDVALAVESILGGGFVAHGYSAVTGAWDSIPLTGLPGTLDYAISRFVIGIRDEDAYRGFAARTGRWASLAAVPPGGPPEADGNVVVCDLFDPFTGAGTPNVAAFSGVRGTWSVSPIYSPTSATLLDHNVAYLRADAPLGFTACAYSAYEARWVNSSVVRQPAPDLIESLSDNVVLIEEEDPAKEFEAFGSEPASWALLTGSWRFVAHEESYALVLDAAETRLAAFGGECHGAWSSEAVSAGGAVVGAGDHAGLYLEANVLHAFTPATNAWLPPLGVAAGAALVGEDALSDVRDGSFQGAATRWGHWTPGPAVPAAFFNVVSAGSVIAHQQVGGAGNGDVYIYDERCDVWPAPFNPGPTANLLAERNLVLAFATGGATNLWGYSVQRGDWTAPVGFTAPLTTLPVLDENVAVVTDSGGRLWGFAAPNEGHVYNAWPNGTEYQISGKDDAGTPFVAYGIHANPGDLVWVDAAPSKVHPGFAIPGVGGLLCLNPFQLIELGLLGVVDPDCMLELLLFLFNPLPDCVQIWFQPVIFDSGTLTLKWGDRCDPGWFF